MGRFFGVSTPAFGVKPGACGGVAGRRARAALMRARRVGGEGLVRRGRGRARGGGAGGVNGVGGGGTHCLK